MSSSGTNTWTDHFAGNFSWSNATMVTKGMAPYGVVALGEIERIGLKLKARFAADANDKDAWWQEWCAMAAHVERLADTAAGRGHQLTAGDTYMRAGFYYYTAERMVYPGPRKTEIYQKSFDCHRKGLARSFPQIEPVEVPYEGKSLPAYFLKAAGNPTRPAPTVVVFDGLDNCKEMSVLFAGLEFSRRGFNTLAIDGPGQGETLRLRGIFSRHDYEVAGTAAFDYVAQRPEVDAGRVAVMGYSFGGYTAPRMVAFEQRYCAGVAFGAMFWDMQAWMKRVRDQMRSGAAATSHFQIPWVLGILADRSGAGANAMTDLDFDKAIDMIGRFSLAGVAERITCPFLVMHGENDRIVPPGEARILYDKIGSPRKTLKIFSAEEGGAEHCQVDDRQAGVNMMADWLTDTVFRAS